MSVNRKVAVEPDGESVGRSSWTRRSAAATAQWWVRFGQVAQALGEAAQDGQGDARLLA